MQFDYKPAKATISGDSLSIIGTVSATLVGGSITASVSGQKVYLSNDGINNVVAIDPSNNTVKGQISGQTVRLVNDSVNNVVFAQIDPANNTVKGQISGQTIRFVNDSVNNVVFAQIDPANNTVKGQISGQTIRFVNDNVNNVVFAKIDPANNAANISGNAVRLTDDGLNNVAKISGQNVYNYGNTPKTNALVTCIGTSGGTALPNITCVKLYVRSVSGNDVMFVGGTGAQAPFSGTGIELYGGEVLPLEVGNANQIQIFAATANQKVSIFAVDK